MSDNAFLLAYVIAIVGLGALQHFELAAVCVMIYAHGLYTKGQK